MWLKRHYVIISYCKEVFAFWCDFTRWHCSVWNNEPHKFAVQLSLLNINELNKVRPNPKQPGNRTLITLLMISNESLKKLSSVLYGSTLACPISDTINSAVAIPSPHC